jgi:hypothetical protein
VIEDGCCQQRYRAGCRDILIIIPTGSNARP